MLKSIFQQFFHRQARRRRRRMTDGKAMDVFPDDIGFQVDDGSRMFIHEGRIGHGMGNDGHGKLAVTDGYDGQADTIDGNGPLSDNERFHVFRDGNGDDPGNTVGCDAGDMTDAVDMAADDMAAQPAADLHSPFKVDLGATLDGAERRATHGFMHNVSRKGRIRHIRNRQANAVDGNAVAELRAF